MILPAVGLAIAFMAAAGAQILPAHGGSWDDPFEGVGDGLQDGALEAGLLLAAGVAVWLGSAVLAWRRPTRLGLAAILRAALLTGFASVLLLLPALARPGQPRSIQLSAAAGVAAWGLRMAFLSRAAGLHLGLSPVARTAGILAASSVLGGSWLFWSQLRHVARLTGPHDAYEAARLQVAYAGGIGLVLVVPILLFIGTAIYLMLRDEA